MVSNICHGKTNTTWLAVNSCLAVTSLVHSILSDNFQMAFCEDEVASNESTPSLRQTTTFMYLSSFFIVLQFLLITHQPHCRQKHDQAMATVSKHHRKKERKCDDGEQSWRKKENQKCVLYQVCGSHLPHFCFTNLLPGFTSW